MRAEALAELLELTSPQARARAGQDRVLPVLPELAGLLPMGGLQAGTVTTVTDAGLLLALAAGPSVHSANVWTAVLGWPSIGLLAAEGYGLDLRKVVVVDEPGPRWPECLVALATGFDVVIVQPTATPTPALANRLEARLRQHRCAVLTMDPWPGSQLRLEVTAQQWSGLGDGHGMLQSRRVRVRSSGRGRAGQVRTAELLLPNERGEVAELSAQDRRSPADTPEPLLATGP